MPAEIIPDNNKQPNTANPVTKMEKPKPEPAAKKPDTQEIHYAGFWRRAGALTLDNLIINIAFLQLMGLFALLIGLFDGEPFSADMIEIWAEEYSLTLTGVFLLGNMLYHIIMVASRHRGTLGKIICGIVVTDLEGNRLGIGTSICRYLSYFVTNMTIFIGYIMCVFTKKKQCLHDMIVDTLVIRTHKSRFWLFFFMLMLLYFMTFIVFVALIAIITPNGDTT